jgi:hypothetical protein
VIARDSMLKRGILMMSKRICKVVNRDTNVDISY